ncbi:hypothetical protein AB0P16_14840 [Dietzia maris]|uniref:hypothetical protein n=1 Tax=Dietzia maris TaxID=37915 RepID=UPI002274A6D6
MDLTTSIGEITGPLSAELTGSADPVGSSFIDTLSAALFIGPNLLLNFIGDLGYDLGSTGSLFGDGGLTLPA